MAADEYVDAAAARAAEVFGSPREVLQGLVSDDLRDHAMSFAVDFVQAVEWLEHTNRVLSPALTASTLQSLVSGAHEDVATHLATALSTPRPAESACALAHLVDKIGVHVQFIGHRVGRELQRPWSDANPHMSSFAMTHEDVFHQHVLAATKGAIGSVPIYINGDTLLVAGAVGVFTGSPAGTNKTISFATSENAVIKAVPGRVVAARTERDHGGGVQSADIDVPGGASLRVAVGDITATPQEVLRCAMSTGTVTGEGGAVTLPLFDLMSLEGRWHQTLHVLGLGALTDDPFALTQIVDAPLPLTQLALATRATMDGGGDETPAPSRAALVCDRPFGFVLRAAGVPILTGWVADPTKN